MEGLGELYYNSGIELFEKGYYELAVERWIQAFDQGYDRQQILENLYACFILPNEQEFRNNFLQNREGITQISFEECEIDFIPVSEKKFYLFDKKENRFRGSFEVIEESAQEQQREFGSILYADIWDIREMLPGMKEKKWDVVYIVVNELETKFVSFLKLPGFREQYLSNAAVFQNTKLMYDVFEEYEEFYLPKNITAINTEKYLGLINELHMKRLHSNRKRENIFLSICIPSYNRGSVALKNVRHLLQCPYDSEIEIIVSNNGSVEDTEAYCEIQKIQDARVVYHEFEKNRGLASNVLKVLELAKGEYAILISDEDLIILDHLGEYFTYLNNYSSGGVFMASGLGENSARALMNIRYRAGMEAVSEVSNANYLTGITFNMKVLKEINAFERVSALGKNVFFEYYPHIPLMMMVCMHADFCVTSLPFWEEKNTVGDDERNIRFLMPEVRVAQQNDFMEFYRKGLNISEKDLYPIFIAKSGRSYILLELAYSLKKLQGFYTWENICFFMYREQAAYLENFLSDLTEKEKEERKSRLKKMLFEFLQSEKVLQMYSIEEQQEKRSFYQKLEQESEQGKEISEIEAEVMTKYPWQKEDRVQEEMYIIDTFMVENEI